MNNFNYYSPTRIIFGENTIDQAGKWMKPLGKKVLLHYGGGSIKKNGVYDTVVESLKKEGIEIVECSGVVPNPRYSKIMEAVEICRKENVDCILAVGGGSVIDSAKSIAAGVYITDEDLWDDYFMPHKRPTKALPLGVVLTIPAAGSETNHGAVVTNDVTHYKRSIGADCLTPVFAIIDPKCHVTIPNFQTACGAADIMAHLLERYFTNTEHVDYSDRLLEASLKTVIHFAPLALQDPENIDVRKEMAWVGTLAHNGLLGKGRAEDWASHDLQHELGAIYDMIHGEGLACVFPAWMKYVYKHDLKRFAQYANRVWGIEYAAHEEEYAALEAIRRTEEFFRRIGLRTHLSEMGIDSSKFEEMAEKLVEGKDHSGNFVPIRKEDAVKIYELAL